MRSIRLADTIYLAFTTRAFATGIPTTLAGTPVVSHYEDAGLTPMTNGITLGVDHDGVTGLNMLTIVATGANGFATGKDYNLVITTGTVGGVSVVGEVVGQFSIERDAVNVVKISDDATAADNLEADYDGTGYAKAASTIGTCTTNTDMVGTDNAALASVNTEARLAELDAGNLPTDVAAVKSDTGDISSRIPAALIIGRMSSDVQAISTDTNAANNLELDYDGTGYAKAASTIGTCTTNTDMVGTDNAALASVCTEARLSECDAATGGKMANQVDEIRTDTGEIGTAGAGLTDLGGMATGMKTEVNAEVADVIDTDTSGEPAQGAPAATASLRKKLDWLYKVFRNKKTQTATDWKLYDDAGTTVDSKATVSADGTTATKEEVVTGP